MLPKFSLSEAQTAPRITKTSGGRDASLRGAFARGEKIDFTAEVKRTLGSSALVLRLWRDVTAEGEENRDGTYRDVPFAFSSTDGVCDVYRLTLDTAKICGDDPSALFYYEYIFLRGIDTLFSDTGDNVNYALSSREARPFRLLVYENGFKVPEWIGGGTMYHVFVDRFRKGEGEVSFRADSVLDEDWERGVPQYAKVRGGDVRNNVFFGGNLWGVAEKLPYLSSLGVTVIYLSPIFEAYSNHKYDTSDYMRVDSGFGGEAAFRELIRRAHDAGIRVILDGVFNHTGNDSVYFDEYGRYGLPAADERSPYHDWFRFFTDENGNENGEKTNYESWWGIKILPKLNLNNVACREFLAGRGGVADKYIRLGADGWRLDVADELPDEFLEELRRTARDASPEAFIVGEVWENAADKVSYGKRRKYFRGRQLDSVMNYPLRTALIDYARSRNASRLAETLTELWSSYPPAVCASLMNIVGTHDTERILSVLGDPEGARLAETSSENSVLAGFRLGEAERERGLRLLRVVSALQFTVFGFPCVYYGDETGMEGLGDPFCRMPMNWSAPDRSLTEHYARLGAIRRENPEFSGGDFRVRRVEGGYIEFERAKNGSVIVIAANLDGTPKTVRAGEGSTDLYSGAEVSGDVAVPDGTFIIIREN